MSMTFPEGIAITVLSNTVTGTDAYGNDVETPTPTVVTGAFAPAGSSEILGGRDTVIENDTVYIPSGTVVQPTDQIQIGTKVYQVVGSPNNWISPFSDFAPGVAVTLQYVSG